MGYSTISVTLPPQKLTNGMVQVKVVEGRMSQINIKGNHYFSDENIRRALPSLTTNILINTNGSSPNWTRPTPTATGKFTPSSVPARTRAPRI